MQPYDERLTVPRSWWFLAVGAGVSLALVLLPLGTLPMLAGLVGGAALAAAGVSAYGSARIDHLFVGSVGCRLSNGT